mgnify:CR=1 FL=1
MTNQCDIEINLDTCFMEHKGKPFTDEKNYFDFKNQEMREQYQRKFEDPDERFLKNMELFLKY